MAAVRHRLWNSAELAATSAGVAQGLSAVCIRGASFLARPANRSDVEAAAAFMSTSSEVVAHASSLLSPSRPFSESSNHPAGTPNPAPTSPTSPTPPAVKPVLSSFFVKRFLLPPASSLARECRVRNLQGYIGTVLNRSGGTTWGAWAGLQNATCSGSRHFQPLARSSSVSCMNLAMATSSQVAQHRFLSSTGSRRVSGAEEEEVDAAMAAAREEIDEINQKFAEARDEIEMAMESKDTVYFNEEADSARKATKEAINLYQGLLSRLGETARGAVQRSMGLKMEQLKAELEQLNQSDH